MKKIKKISIILSLILIITLTIILLPKGNKNLDDNIEVKNIGNGMLSIMLEKSAGSNEYIESTETSFKQENYNFNVKLSKCINGSKLKYNEKTNNINVETSKTDKCYLYFDNINVKTNYTYTGNYETYIVPTTGTYKIELWGAQGDDYGGYKGGRGAYTSGNIVLNKNEKLYIYVGNVSKTVNVGSFNGGGASATSFGGAGGGATDVRLVGGEWNIFDSLKSRIMVAAGGGGANNRNTNSLDSYYGAGNGGYGGALVGGDGESFDATHKNPNTGEVWGWSIGKGATQTAGGIKEKHSDTHLDSMPDNIGKFGYAEGDQSGGGSGYYAGASSAHGGGGGGSSFISGYKGCVAIKDSSTEENVLPKDNCKNGTSEIACSYHYSGKIFTETQMIAGNITMPKPEGGTEVGHTGNGYARITFVK